MVVDEPSISRETAPVHDVADTLGQRVRAERESLGMSQDVLAVRAKLSSATIYRIEADKHFPRPVTLMLLARALRTTPRVLLGERRGVA